ncbi:hypothetical protein [Eleftheria terrae]|uniref:hypothetical protein n=1 Tax=Eleftheria terrae TaxID=1597781 RepID=UPI00263AB58A|nr:hypothetical protein [Eleftheria terrae]WKB50838.1 hypothetical protein N7L95_13540 [Eleftheria terrae]
MSKTIQLKFSLCTIVVALAAFVFTYAGGAKKTHRSEIPAGGENHLDFALPSPPKSAEKSVRLRIPREYVWLEGIMREESGEIGEIPIQVELPGPKPWPSGDTKGRVAAQQKSERFIVRLGAGSAVGGRSRFLRSLQPTMPEGYRTTDMHPDGELYGLVRHSQIRCYTADALKQTELTEFWKSKPADDPLKQTNCRLDRRSAVYFSPPSVLDTAIEQVIFARCSPSSCSLTFHVGHLSASMHVEPAQLSKWQDLVLPIQDLLRSFIVN